MLFSMRGEASLLELGAETESLFDFHSAALGSS